MIFASNLTNRLANNAAQLKAARAELEALNEQAAFFADEADDKRLEALVAETPLADSEARSALRTADAFAKERDRLSSEIAKLEAAQNELLDELAAQVEASGNE